MNHLCPACQQPNPGEATFCGQCGVALKKTVSCATCGRTNPNELAYCRGCGARLGRSSASLPPELTVSVPTFFAAGRYRIERILGEGSKKRVYLAQDTRLNRLVALAVFKSASVDRDGQLRIQREAHALARLGDHPHIVTLYDVGDEAGQAYFVSQYVAGGTLQEWLQRSPHQRLSLAEALRVSEELCLALSYAHEHGILHRDLKPSNVWLAQDGTVKLGDFGLAASLEHSRLTLEGVLMGTAAYLPPEQLQGSQATVQSDLYSLGAILYETVTGRPPFVGDNLVSLIAQHLNTPPVAPVQYTPELPAEVNTLILQLLAKQPTQRPTSAAAVQAALHTRTLAATAPPARTPTLDRLASDVFVGREHEMDVLRASLEETLAGQGRAVVLLGEPGIGKTRLATELTAYAQVRGIRVLLGRCPDSDGAPPYWPWVQIIRSYAQDCPAPRLRTELGVGISDIAQVIPAIQEQFPDLLPSPRLEPEQERFRFFDSLVTFLKNVAKRQPMLLVLDDLQWADASSLLFLQHIARELTDTKLLFVVTCREADVSQHALVPQTLATLARTAGSRTVSLRRLTDAEVSQFIEITTGQSPTAAVSAAVFARTEGHPFFMTEVVRLLATGQAATEQRVGPQSLPGLPSTVRHVIEQRVATVSEHCRQMLTLAAVVGREFELQVLSALPISHPLDLLDEALSARLIVEVTDSVGRYTFTHALIQETLYTALSTTKRLMLHRQVGEALEQLAGESVTSHLSALAHHFFLAAQVGVGVDKAIAYATRAAEQATTALAYEEASAHYERALQAWQLQPTNAEVRCNLLLALGASQQRSQAVHPAAATFQHAADIARTLQLPKQFAQAALGCAGDLVTIRPISETRNIPLLEEALEMVGHELLPLRVRLLVRLALEFWRSDEHRTRKLLLVEEAEKLTRTLQDPNTLVYVLYARLYVLCGELTNRELLPLSSEIMRLTQQIGNYDLMLPTSILHVFFLLERGNRNAVDVEIAHLEQVRTAVRQPSSVWQVYVLFWRGMQALLTGRFAEVQTLLQHAMDLGQTTQYSADYFLMFSTSQSFMLHYHLGRLHEVEAELQRVAARYPAVWGYRCLLATLYSELGQETEARRFFEALAERDFVDFAFHPARRLELAALVLPSIFLRDERRMTLLYDALAPYAHENVSCLGAVALFDSVAGLLGRLASHLRRWEEAQQHFEFALQLTQQMGARPHLAHTQYEYARMLLARQQPGDDKHAVTLLDHALATAQQLGMAGLADKIQELGVKGWGLAEAHSAQQMEDAEPRTPNNALPTPSSFRREGDFWSITYEGVVLRLKDTTGLQYLAQLLQYPEQEFHVLDLVGGNTSGRTATQGTTNGLETAGLGDAGEVLDAQARNAYKHRLQELQEELTEAREFNDRGRIEKLEEEVDFLTQELAGAVGLGGRNRKAASAAQRARVNVTLSIKNVLKKIDKQHPSLALYFSTTIKTGTFCSYTPDPRLPVTWEF